MIEARTGIYYSDVQLDLLGGKLTLRATELGMITFLDYYYLLKYDPAGAQEWLALESMVTVNETFFWRDPTPLQVAAQTLVGSLREALDRPVKIWHAACSSGEEPFSMVMALHQENLCDSSAVEILATDLDRQVLEKARRGLYRGRSLRCLPPHFRERYFRAHHSGEYEFDCDLGARVEFRTLNLVDDRALEELRDFDLIFCRNVLTYFRDPTIARVAASLYHVLSTRGHLFLGACDSFLRFGTPFQFSEVAGQISYRRLDCQ